MPKVAIVVRGLGPSQTEAVKELRTCFGLGLGEIYSAIRSSELAVERRLFDRGDASFPERLCRLLLYLEQSNIPYDAFELTDQQSFATSDRSTLFKMTPDVLRNLIDSRSASIATQKRVAYLEDPEED